MPILTPRLTKVFRRVRKALPLFMEIMVTVTSVWVAVVLLADQNYFDQRPMLFGTLAHSRLWREWQWGLLALFAAVTKSIGMAITTFSEDEHDLDAAFLFRLVGWGASAFLWGGISYTVIEGNLFSISAATSVAMFGLSFGALLAGPAMPDDRRLL